MKVFAAILIAAFAVHTNAAPATQAVDFNVVAAKVAEIEASVRNSAEQVLSIANNDNAAVGAAISNKANIAANSAAIILQQANDAVAAQTLTVSQVRSLNGDLKGVAGKLLGSIQPELAQLSPIAAAKIRAVFNTNFDNLNVLASQLSALLTPESKTFVVDWDAVSNKVADIENTVRQAGQQVVDAASSENEAVASNIANKVREASVPAAGILQQANDAVAAQTLTVGQSRQLTGDLKSIVSKLLGDIQPDLGQLTPITAGQIRATIVATIKTIEVQADELSALLSA